MRCSPSSRRRVSDRRLVAAAQRGDRRATDALLRRYDARVRALVRGLRLPRGAEADDIAQAARLGLLGAIMTWRPGRAAFADYARTCARRRALSAIDDANTATRRLLTHAVSLEHLIELGVRPRGPQSAVSGFVDPVASVIAREQLAAITAAARRLSARQAACLAGQLNGLSYAEIARLVGGTTKSVAMCIQHARERLAAAVLE